MLNYVGIHSGIERLQSSQLLLQLFYLGLELFRFGYLPVTLGALQLLLQLPDLIVQSCLLDRIIGIR